MCGICGFVGIDLPQESLVQMTRMLTHRGPDDEGFHHNHEQRVGLGVRRLAIIDLAGGNQPISNEDGSVWVGLNGEIYNYAELRHELAASGHRFRTQSDTEVIVHAYEEWGRECLNRFRGMFGFALLDYRNKLVLLARDRIGEKPLYYLSQKDGLLFASEIKSILACPGINRQVNEELLPYYLTFNYFPGEKTFFRNIFRLAPAEYLLYHWPEKSFKKDRYWDIASIEPASSTLSLTDLLPRLKEKLAEAVRYCRVSDVPVGCFLSGGLDSSAIVALAAQQSAEPLKTFSVIFKNGSFYDESRYCRLVAKQFRTEHYEEVVTPPSLPELLPKIIWHLDEPLADPVCIPTYLIARSARNQVKVVLTGEGSDEIFAGYLRYRVDQLISDFQALPYPLLRLSHFILGFFRGNQRIEKARAGLLLNSLPGRYAAWLTRSRVEIRSALYPRPLNPAIADFFRPLFAEVAGKRPLEQLLFADLKNWLGNLHLYRLDKMSMANSLESRAPFLDYRLVEFVSRIPPEYKLHQGVGKYVLRQVMQGILPKPVLSRKKHGFTVPLTPWFRQELRSYMQDILTSQRFRERGYFVPRVVEKILGEHFRAKADYGDLLYALLVFELWQEIFIDA